MNDPRRFAAKFQRTSISSTSPAVTAGAVCGRLLAISTITAVAHAYGNVSRQSAMFHLAERSQPGMRKLGAEVHAFTKQNDITTAQICTTLMAGDEEGTLDEGCIIATMCFIPGLIVGVIDEADILKWVMQENPKLPNGLLRRNLNLAQTRAIELAQYALGTNSFGQTL